MKTLQQGLTDADDCEPIDSDRRHPFGDREALRMNIVILEQQSYVVPILAKAIDIVERLQRYPNGLRIEDLYELTGYAKSSIYRIVRTLAVFGYLKRDRKGFFSVHSTSPRKKRSD